MIFQVRVCDAATAEALAAEALELPSWQDGTQSAGEHIRSRKRNKQAFVAPEALLMRVARLMGSAPVVERIGPASICTPRFSQYAAGDHYDWHVDGSLGSPQERTDVSMSLLLQKPARGGRISLRVGDLVLELDPLPGEAVFWASHIEHRVEPVEHGLRVVAIAGAQCQVADPVAREVLCRIGRLQRFHAHGDGRDDYAFALANTLRLWHR